GGGPRPRPRGGRGWRRPWCWGSGRTWGETSFTTAAPASTRTFSPPGCGSTITTRVATTNTPREDTTPMTKNTRATITTGTDRPPRGGSRGRRPKRPASRRSTREVFEDHLRCRRAGAGEGDLPRNYPHPLLLLPRARLY